MTVPVYMLDTSILSDLIRNANGKSYKKVVEHGSDAICSSMIVAAELRYGCIKKGSAVLTARVESLLARIQIFAFDAPADAEYGRIRSALEATGRVIGNNDMFIAAHACALGMVLVSNNQREFSRVPGLTTEDWLA